MDHRWTASELSILLREFGFSFDRTPPQLQILIPIIEHDNIVCLCTQIRAAQIRPDLQILCVALHLTKGEAPVEGSRHVPIQILLPFVCVALLDPCQVFILALEGL